MGRILFHGTNCMESMDLYQGQQRPRFADIPDPPSFTPDVIGDPCSRGFPVAAQQGAQARPLHRLRINAAVSHSRRRQSLARTWWFFLRRGQFFAHHLPHGIDHRTLLDKRNQRVIDQGLVTAMAKRKPGWLWMRWFCSVFCSGVLNADKGWVVKRHGFPRARE